MAKLSQSALQEIQAIFQKALAAHQAGDFITAKTFYAETLAHIPNDTGVLRNMGNLHLVHARYAEAANYYQRAIDIGQVPPVILKTLGIAQSRIARHAEALASFDAYAAHAPEDTEIATDRLESLHATGRFDEALAYAATLPTAHPQIHGIAVMAAESEMAKGNPDAAIARLQPYADSIECIPALGKAYGQARRFDDAVTTLRRAVMLAPQSGTHQNNLGNALNNAGDQAGALEAFVKARTLDPNLAAATLVNEAAVEKRLQNIGRAITLIREALVIDPTNPHAHYALGTLSLMNQDYRAAWPHIEWRWHRNDPALQAPPFPEKLWYGEALAGRTLTLYTDQGIGDTLQMLRFIPLVQSRFAPAAIRLIGPQKLQALITASAPGVTYIAGDAPGFDWAAQKFDALAAICSLPAILDIGIRDIPVQTPLAARSKKTYRRKDGEFVIGLSWFTKSRDAGYKRSLKLADFAFLKDIPNIRVIDLQYGDTAAERAESGLPIHHDDSVDAWADLQPFIDQIHACDLVLSVDNTTVHAAGAAGVPVWTLLPFDPYWRWHTAHGADGAGNPWYPTMRLFRQDTDGDYAPVLRRIETMLHALVAGDRTLLTPPPFVPRPGADADADKPTALLLNDTSAWYHWGCTGTSRALRMQMAMHGYDVVPVHHLEIADRRITPPQPAQFDDAAYLARCRYLNPSLYAAMSRATRVVVNGEGTITGLKDNALRLLHAAHTAKAALGRNTRIINHACFPGSPDAAKLYAHVYKGMDAVVVRDPQSQAVLAEMGINAQLAFDSLPLAVREWRATHAPLPVPETPYVVLAGSSLFSSRATAALHRYTKYLSDKGYGITCLVGAAHHPANDDHDFLEIMRRAPVPVTIYNATSFNDWMTHLAQAALLVSGRFHYAIAAACLGTPFIAFEGNTPKLHALCETLGEKPPLSYEAPDIYDRLKQRTPVVMESEDARREGAAALTDTLCRQAMGNFTGL